MIRIPLLLIAAAGIGLAASASAALPGEDAWAEPASAAAASAAMTGLRARAAAAPAEEPSAEAPAGLRHWDIASNNSNAPEIYALLRSARAPACVEKTILVNGRALSKTDCSVSAPIERLTVTINDILWSTTERVKVSGEAACRQEWRVVPQGRRQTAQQWTFCSFSGVVEPKNPG
jgi:hypothetical protein